MWLLNMPYPQHLYPEDHSPHLATGAVREWGLSIDFGMNSQFGS